MCKYYPLSGTALFSFFPLYISVFVVILVAWHILFDIVIHLLYSSYMESTDRSILFCENLEKSRAYAAELLSKYTQSVYNSCWARVTARLGLPSYYCDFVDRWFKWLL